jgi:HK97 gp10 family phage protein
MPLHITIQGLDELRATAGASASLLDREVKTAMVSSVNTIKNQAQHLAPFKTGTLRRSIFTDLQNNGYTGIVGQDPSQAIYGSYIEYGTGEFAGHSRWLGNIPGVGVRWIKGMRARPFMTPAFENNIEKVKDLFLHAMDKVVKSMAK